MADSSPSSTDGTADAEADDRDSGPPAAGVDGGADADSVDALRREVEEKYDFENFGPSDMAQMSAEEWEAAFDPDTWIVGPDLLDRVEQDLKGRIASREVFAVLERFETDGEERLIAYSDEGYAVVAPDGSVEGQGTVLRDVKPTVALCSMDSYEVPEAPDDVSLPSPADVPEGTGQLGNNLLQLIAFAQILVGFGLVGVWLFTDAIPTPGGYVDLVAPMIALIFVGIGVFLFAVVANARLSDRFRAEEFRERLRATGVEDGDRPDFLPPLDENGERPEMEPGTTSGDGAETADSDDGHA
ncbi:DUF7319 domain-containing protein [Haloplanus natans]|uniref:DUF7319 domain-containing protein n=1 Tax=Haloplanus natans TaxID=376171 RepID=UPI0006776CFA|nr:hypothetical protein [Haloplanus natans]